MHGNTVIVDALQLSYSCNIFMHYNDKVLCHSDYVRSVSWSPSGGHIASGSYDGTILIRKAENGKVEVGPIETGQGRVCSLAYSPSGDRIASGGYNETICIWDSNTGKLLVGPIKDLGALVNSVVWSSDSSKLYSALAKFARVFVALVKTLVIRLSPKRQTNVLDQFSNIPPPCFVYPF